MSDRYLPSQRRWFLEDMRIKGLRAMRDFTRFLPERDKGGTG